MSNSRQTLAAGAAEADVVLRAGKEGPARAGHPWVFSGAIAELRGSPTRGAVVRVLASDGRLVGTGTYNPSGTLAVRLFSSADVPLDHEFFVRRLSAAIDLRRSQGIMEVADAFRLVNGEGDLLPGFIVDVYGEFAVCQILTAGADRLREPFVNALQSVLAFRGVYERSSSGARRDEGLVDRIGTTWGEDPPERIEIREYGAGYLVDPRGGQKTGFYLDQRENRHLAARLAKGRSVLNCFAYTGGFAIAAARAGAAMVRSVETSGPSLRVAREAFQLNGLDESVADWVAGDVFEYLTLAESQGERFDLVVLDPPPFARSRGDRDRAVRAYRDLNRRAFRVLATGGTLLSFSCSAHLTREVFEHVVATAAPRGLVVQTLARLGAGADHPVLAAHPEGEYLKGVAVRLAGERAVDL